MADDEIRVIITGDSSGLEIAAAKSAESLKFVTVAAEGEMSALANLGATTGLLNLARAQLNETLKMGLTPETAEESILAELGQEQLNVAAATQAHAAALAQATLVQKTFGEASVQASGEMLAAAAPVVAAQARLAETSNLLKLAKTAEGEATALIIPLTAQEAIQKQELAAANQALVTTAKEELAASLSSPEE